MDFSYFSSIYEVFIGLLSALVGFTSLQSFFLDRYMNHYDNLFEERNKLIEELEYLEKTTKNYSQFIIKHHQNEPNLLDYIKRLYFISEKVDEVKKEVEKLKKEENFIKDKQNEEDFSKRIMLSVSAFAVIFYFFILLTSGFCSSKYFESFNCMTFVAYWELLIFLFYAYYLKVLTCQKDICNKYRKEINEQIGYIFIFKKFALILTITIVIFFLSYLLKLDYINFYWPFLIIMASFIVFFLPFFSLLYRFVFYLKAKSDNIKEKINAHKQSIRTIRLEIKI